MIKSLMLAAMACSTYPEMTEMLEQRYSEEKVAQGVSQPILVEIWASFKGTWTMLFVAPNGVACITRYGDGYRPPPPERPEEEDG